MICREDVVPVYVIVMIAVCLFLLVGALRGFTIEFHHHKNRVSNGLPWDESISEHMEDLSRIKERYGRYLYYISYGYVMFAIERFNHPYRLFFLVTIFLLIGLKLLLGIC